MVVAALSLTRRAGCDRGQSVEYHLPVLPDLNTFHLAPSLAYPRRVAALRQLLDHFECLPDAPDLLVGRATAVDAITPELEALPVWAQARPGRGHEQDRIHYGLVAGRRLRARVIVALAAEVAFAPYAAGYWQATEPSRTTLRDDLAGACSLLWTWGNVEYRVTAALLGEALRDPHGRALAFPPFVRFFELVLGLHLLGPQRARAEMIAALAVDALRQTAPGATASSRISRPVVRELEGHPDPAVRLTLDDRAPSWEETLAKAVVPVLQDVRHGARSVEDAEAILGRIVGALRTVG